jgi:GTP cyclohydrolase III
MFAIGGSWESNQWRDYAPWSGSTARRREELFQFIQKSL